jgi:hypothetical protein
VGHQGAAARAAVVAAGAGVAARGQLQGQMRGQLQGQQMQRAPPPPAQGDQTHEVQQHVSGHPAPHAAVVNAPLGLDGESGGKQHAPPLDVQPLQLQGQLQGQMQGQHGGGGQYGAQPLQLQGQPQLQARPIP